MAMQSSARIKGDDYQFLFTWLEVLNLLKKNSNVAKVRIEDPDATFVDDVTVFFKDGTPPSYYQVKYHVDQRSSYTLELLLEKGKTGKSLMEKFHQTYKDYIAENPGFAATLHLVSNWGLHHEDKILSGVENEHSRISQSILSALPTSEIGKKLKSVADELRITEQELSEFLKTLCFYTGRECTDDFKKRVQERMEALGLKSSEADLALAVQIVRDWVKEKFVEVNLGVLEAVLKKWDLYEPPSGPKSATVYLVTVKKHQFELQPDYIIDLRKYYAEQGEIKGHELLPGFEYNKTLLPKINLAQKKVSDETKATLIRARGFSRLSPWFAFGYTFSGVSGYTIEVDQNGKLWRTDETPTSSFKLVRENGKGEVFATNTGTVAVGLSLSGSIVDDVKEYISKEAGIDAVLFLRPENELGPTALQRGGDVVALTRQFKTIVRDFVRERKASKLMLFYFGPLSGACFIGHQLNAICQEVQIMEKLSGAGYIKSFLLS